MRVPGLAKAKPLLGAVAVVTALAMVPAPTAAQSVFFSGYTNGWFGGAMPPDEQGYQSHNLGFLSYINSQFEGTTNDGFLGMGNAPSDLGTQNENNFGAFYLSPQAFNYNGGTFTLRITFFDPVANFEVFTAAIIGSVGNNGAGGAYINFDNTPIVWSDANGTYSVQVNDVSIIAADPYAKVALTGNLTAVVPEPFAMVLMGTGLLGLGVARRRRSSLQDADLV